MPLTKPAFRRAALSALLAAVLAGSFLAAGNLRAEPLPVTFNFFAGIPAELAHPGGSLPGSNDFACKPSSRHPRPVVLAHGTGGSQQTNWGTYVPLLKNEGYCVFALTYGAPTYLPWPGSAIGGMGTMEDSAKQFKTFVDKVLRATGASKFDVVGHSQGTVVPAYYAKYLGGRNKIGKYVSLAPAWNGTTLAGTDLLLPFWRGLGVSAEQVPVCHACFQLDPQSPFLRKVRAGGYYLPNVEYTNIATRHDELIVPYWLGLPPGRNTRNIVVQDGCPVDYTEHAGVAGSRRAAYFVLNALDPQHPRPVPCDRAAPFTGAAF
ncbi:MULTISPECIES: triacylglycerol lipase [unclassified Gordonia (in: high G+C Gram-positive bacteria)]|uniref:esterase/lipase family protein n=1 Tax=unclassified Gordonia (in: high G+C Gram-positive bacteria) TaxID=2657482 RepID=UPI001F0D4877|nr:alpha/beta fold hydrolase [Gordonia sp. ABSL49_1]MCH5641919.1 lipase family protein [Gordonia sp. ABSL49_1]